MVNVLKPSRVGRRILAYLDAHPAASINEIRRNCDVGSPKTIVAYRRHWCTLAPGREPPSIPDGLRRANERRAATKTAKAAAPATDVSATPDDDAPGIEDVFPAAAPAKQSAIVRDAVEEVTEESHGAFCFCRRCLWGDE